MKRTISFFLVVFILFLSACSNQQIPSDNLLRSTPEAESVSSTGILNYIQAVEKDSTQEIHSLMVLRHGKVVAEGWWNPYRPDLRHIMHSVSKTFTSTAVGFAVSENRLSVNDKVISFFPDYLPDTVSLYLAQLTIKDLLTMSVGQDPEPKFTYQDPNWVKAFLATPIVNEPGTVFLYNSYATYMVSAILQKVTGQKIIDYLQPRLFEPLNIKGMDWEEDPMGINIGGWGLRVKTEDMAKLGQLYLQKGKWNGKQLLPESWIEEASTAKIIQKPDITQEQRNQDDWAQGYGYQMWRCRHNFFRADGASGQYIIVMPELDAVIAITANVNNMQHELNFVWEYLLPAINGQLPVDKQKDQALKEKLASLSLPVPPKTTSSLEGTVTGKVYTMEENDGQTNSISGSFANDQCMLNLQEGSNSYSFTYGSGKWIAGETNRPGPYYRFGQRDPKGKAPFQVSGYYEWLDDHTLKLVLRYTECTLSDIVTLHFEQDKLTVDMSVGLTPQSIRTVRKTELKLKQ